MPPSRSAPWTPVLSGTATAAAAPAAADAPKAFEQLATVLAKRRRCDLSPPPSSCPLPTFVIDHASTDDDTNMDMDLKTASPLDFLGAMTNHAAHSESHPVEDGSVSGATLSPLALDLDLTLDMVMAMDRANNSNNSSNHGRSSDSARALLLSPQPHLTQSQRSSTHSTAASRTSVSSSQSSTPLISTAVSLGVLGKGSESSPQQNPPPFFSSFYGAHSISPIRLFIPLSLSLNPWLRSPTRHGQKRGGHRLCG
ncbi:hypothetical protein EMPS_06702 [Entomortierella parvispora]|uniref:Uncharacterized protein n=1 Tax=Entomortierella parvispora TaxID=205924 RepID=A0A9P3HCS9_9FUNG|nr:hypothetical protein EMPS_06702 [Entomortierella parvispora]